MTFAPDCIPRCNSTCKRKPDPFPPDLCVKQLRTAIFLCFWTTATLATPTTEPQRVSAQVYADKGFQEFYSGDFFSSAEYYRKAIEIDRGEPSNWTGLAESYLFQLLLAAGRLDSSLYDSTNEFIGTKPPPPDAKVVQAMWDALRAARDLCEAMLKTNPQDARAHYSLAVSYAVEANFHLGVERKALDALSAGGKTRDHAKLAITQDPSLRDANLLLGAYEYSIGSVPGAFRWLLALGGHAGTKARGVELIQDALQNGVRAGPASLALLGVIYTRERQYAYSREMWQHLMRFYPRNYLYELEVARSYMNETNTEAALEVYGGVARKMESGAPGYGAVNAERLNFQIASLLDSKDRAGEALAYYEKVAAHHNPGGPLQARAYLRMGDIFRSLRQKERAREMYEKARRYDVAEVRREANSKLRSLR
jgi:tetratricopeptide (TPR) repeat protein